ncbi:hypothetical protein BLNAU_12216 [Blattamonas nauphoetae]|uniref:Uncharacterized protein n=1 Tax=Blattamonas nauphoetae TaxID=2049346 RepID=A0ABQ9XN22_9EUKA|nr:hypothetical protein BLNAU_12216 [Blattamonas nauphoetae]
MERAGRKHWSVGNDCYSLPDEGGILGCAGADVDDRQGRRQRRLCRGLFDHIVGLIGSELSSTVAEATQNQPTMIRTNAVHSPYSRISCGSSSYFDAFTIICQHFRFESS